MKKPDLRDSKIDLERPTEEAGPNKVEDESLKVLPRWSVLIPQYPQLFGEVVSWVTAFPMWDA
jgi:hypothetical protein